MSWRIDTALKIEVRYESARGWPEVPWEAEAEEGEAEVIVETESKIMVESEVMAIGIEWVTGKPVITG